MDGLNNREVVAARLAEWGISLSESELDQLLPAYEQLLSWQGVLEKMLKGRKIADGMTWPESEPLLIHCIEKSKGVGDG